MKKLLLAAAACIGFSSANAQLPVGTVAPDFTLQDINGVSHHLYSYLDSGYTVILDISAAWCAPCWSAHTSHVFDSLTAHYGPNGTLNPGKIKFIFIEGEAQNTTAQLYGTSGSTNATFTQGDWVTGTNYPIIDNSSLNTPYNLQGYPTFTVICRDRLVLDAQAGWGSSMAAESYWTNIVNNGCPSTAPSATLDAKTVPYNGAGYFVCNANPTVKFQNYSATNNITSAVVEVLNGSTVVATQNWSGNLAPYGVASVTFSPFTSSAFMPYKYRVTVTGDSDPSNNVSRDSLFRIFSAANAQNMPYSQDFESVANGDVPVNFGASSDGNSFVFGSSNLIGKSGAPTKALVFDFYDMSTAGSNTEILAGNYATSNATNVTLYFDVAYAQYSAENDKLEVMVSTDCGANWTTVYSKSGSTLQTHAPVGNGQFFPSAAADWRTESINLNNYKNANMLVKFRGTSDYGNLCWVDNVMLNSTTDVPQFRKDLSLALYPNPAREYATLSFHLAQTSEVSVRIMDATGRVVKNVTSETMSAGDHKNRMSIGDLAAGLYHVQVTTAAGTGILQLTVAK